MQQCLKVLRSSTRLQCCLHRYSIVTADSFTSALYFHRFCIATWFFILNLDTNLSTYHIWYITAWTTRLISWEVAVSSPTRSSCRAKNIRTKTVRLEKCLLIQIEIIRLNQIESDSHFHWLSQTFHHSFITVPFCNMPNHSCGAVQCHGAGDTGDKLPCPRPKWYLWRSNSNQSCWRPRAAACADIMRACSEFYSTSLLESLSSNYSHCVLGLRYMS